MGDFKFYEMPFCCALMVSEIISPLLRTDHFLYIIQQALFFFCCFSLTIICYGQPHTTRPPVFTLTVAVIEYESSSRSTQCM